MNESGKPRESQLTPISYNAVAAYLGFLLFVGCFAQIVTLRILLKKEYRGKCLTRYLINIVAANSLVILGSFPTSFASTLKHGWPFNETLCHMNGFLAGVGCIAMLSTMTCVCLTIWTKAVCHETFNQVVQLVTRDHSWKAITGVWLYSTGLMLPPAIGITNMKKEAAGTNCVPDWSPQRFQDKIYIIVLTIGALVLPFTISVFALYKIRKTLRGHIGVISGIVPHFKLKHFKNIYRMSALSVTAFTLEWLPYAIFVLVSLVCGDERFSSNPGLTMVPALIAKTSVIVNPFIYACVIPR